MASVRVLFIGGLGRSGTTLLERIVGQLPGAVGLGEVVHLWERDLRDGERCSCARPFLECPFWTSVGERAFGGWDNVDVDRVLWLKNQVDRTRFVPALASRSWSRRHMSHLQEYNSYYRRIYRAALTEGGGRLAIDSSKHASLAYCLSHDPDIELRVLHVVRDSRGVAYSWTKQVRRPENDSGDAMATSAPGRTALYWNAHNAAFTTLPRARHDTRVMRVRYEGFLTDPVGMLQAVAEFAGLDPSTSSLSFVGDDAVELEPTHSAAGNPMRFRSGRIAMRRDEAWRRDFPRSQRRLVSLLTAPGLYAYGYPLAGH